MSSQAAATAERRLRAGDSDRDSVDGATAPPRACKVAKSGWLPLPSQSSRSSMYSTCTNPIRVVVCVVFVPVCGLRLRPNMNNFVFGTFDYACGQTALPLCPLVGSSLVTPICYARNVQIAGGFLLFEPATLLVEAVALVMTAVMIYNIKSRSFAVGNKEISFLFYMYAATILLEFFLVSGFIPMASFVYKEFWAVELNELVGTTPTILYTLYFILPLIFLTVYAILQIILVVNALDDRWALVDLLFAYLFFGVGVCLQFGVSNSLCGMASHYVDGVFFGAIFNLLAVMLVYKYWDEITKEDLEYAVGGKVQQPTNDII
ncbi:Chitin synthase, class 7, partial [Physocladia obscura]